MGEAQRGLSVRTGYVAFRFTSCNVLNGQLWTGCCGHARVDHSLQQSLVCRFIQSVMLVECLTGIDTCPFTLRCYMCTCQVCKAARSLFFVSMERLEVG